MRAYLNFHIGDPHGRAPVMVFFKGGSAPPAPKAPKVKLPKPPDPLPPPPPPTEYRADAGQTVMDTRSREARKRGIGATLLAGETSNAGGKRTLLG